jgi:DNA-binding Lrp family transcriptional regulator
MTTDKAAPDWERIETLYRAGTMSVREIAEQSGVSHTAINKRARKEKWARDLSAKIKAQADVLVSRDTVSKEVSSQRVATEKVVVEVEAQVQARIRISHRSAIARSRELMMKLVDELEHHTDNRELLAQLGELMFSPDEKTGRDSLNEIYHAVISLPERTKTIKALSETLKNLIALEREAFGMVTQPEQQKGGLAEMLGQLHRSAVPVVQHPVADDD